MSITWPTFEDYKLPGFNLWNFPRQAFLDYIHQEETPMSNSITTKTGDNGTTHGPSGLRVPKNDSFVELVGVLDELNAQIGFADSVLEDEADTCKDFSRSEEIRHVAQYLPSIQHDLLNIGAELYTGNVIITKWDVKRLENIIEENEENPGGFIIPRGRAATAIHVAKAVARRAERIAVSCSTPSNNVTDQILKYLNRLSDTLYVIALTVAEKPHIMWVTSEKK